MFAYIKGEIIDIVEDNLILEANQIGYNIKISTATAHSLPRIGSTVQIFTYTSVREDVFQLFGFISQDDLAMFRKLITVNGIGPKVGLAILSVMSSDDLRFAILAGDAKFISKAPGIGAKTAERLILDLRDKVSLEEAFEQKSANVNNTAQESNGAQGISLIRSEAIEALVALGYSATVALKAVKEVPLTPESTVEDLLKNALKKVSLL